MEGWTIPDIFISPLIVESSVTLASFDTTDDFSTMAAVIIVLVCFLAFISFVIWKEKDNGNDRSH
jgi:hypothetical protein